jgi:anti-anti-sigma factor
MDQGNEIRVEIRESVALLDIRGDVTVGSEPFLKEAYRKANEQGLTRFLLLGFEPDSYINSGGIAVIIQLLSETKRNNQQVSLTGLSDHFQKIFNMVGITKFAKIYGSEDEALKGLLGEV